MKKSFLATILLCLGLCFSAVKCESAVSESQARAFLNDTGQKLIETLGLSDMQEKYDALDDLFETKVDLDYASKFVLGQYYRRLNKTQKKHYRALFERYLKSLYKSYPLSFETEGMGFEIKSVQIDDKYANALAVVDVPPQFQRENFQTVLLEFKLKEKNGKVFLVDFKIGETSMLITLRNRFLQMIKNDEEEMNWFLEDFEDLVLSNERNLQQ
ncbi:MAG: ABC transporter substrate-binding protein [Alphaproteobacteria bacterium]|nr:ABC transporter substrate-binding protein [Alphaproteobacteria bacterium]